MSSEGLTAESPPSCEGAAVKRERVAWRSFVSRATFIGCLTLLVFAPSSLRNGFVFDDIVIKTSPVIQAPDGLRRIWLTTQAPDYYPVTWSLWWLEWRVWGDRATGYHVVNVLVHALNAILVWLVLRQLNAPGAWFAGVLFAIHPVNVATVAWIFEQKNTLSMLFSLLTIVFYLRFDKPVRLRNHSAWTWYACSLGSFLLALLSKNAVVMMPVVLLGCVWWLRRSLRWRDVLHAVPFFVLSLVFGLINIWFELFRSPEAHTVRHIGILARIAGAGWPPWFYLYKALLPINLTMIYPTWKIDPSRLAFYLPGIMLVSCLVLFWWKRNHWGRPLLFGSGYFVATLIPVLGFVDQGFYRFSLVADHWQYYSIAGVIALAAAGGKIGCDRLGKWGAKLAPVAATVIVVALAATSWTRAAVYQNDETLWADNVRKNPQAWAAHYNLGLAYWQAGRRGEAFKEYRATLRVRPEFSEAHNNLGLALVGTGALEDAIVEYRESLRLQPNNVEAHINLGAALLRRGQIALAIGELSEAVRLQPKFSVARFTLASALDRAGRVDEAVAQYREGLRLAPDYAPAHNNLGVILARQGKDNEAIGQFATAVRLDPNYADAQKNLSAMIGKQPPSAGKQAEVK